MAGTVKSSTKKRSSTKEASAKKPAASTKGGSGSRSRKAAPPPPKRVEMEPERIRELWGIALIVVALLAGLGLYRSGSAGMVGVILVNVFRGLFGVFGLAVPPIIAAVGVMLLGRPRESNPRVLLGGGIVLTALLGLWHLAQGGPGTDSVASVIHDSGGWAGMAVALPLRALAALPGAVVVLIGVLAAGLLVMTATSPKIAWHAVTTFFLRDEPRPRRRWSADDATEAADPNSDYVQDFGPEDPEVDLTDEEFGRGSRGRGRGRGRSLGSRLGLADETAAEAVAAEPEATDEQRSTAVFTDAAALLDTQPFEDEPEAEAEAVAAPSPEMIDTSAIAPVEDDGAARKLVIRGDQPYELPSLDLLRTGRAAVGNSSAMESMTMALERMLREFGVDARVVAVRRGPTVTRFEIELGTGVKVAAITKLEKDIAYALATPEIRIVAPIPGKVAIGIEVPNSERDHITLGDILRSGEARAATHPLTAAIGVDIAGRPILVNLAKMPHLLIAGATGSGKSVTMNGIVTSVIMRNSPEDVRMILIDPKRVEMATYEDIPHLLTQVVTDPKRAKDALDWVVGEMERRYDLLARHGHRNIDRFNEEMERRIAEAEAAAAATAEAAAERALAAEEADAADTEPASLAEAEMADLRASLAVEEEPVAQTEEVLPYILCVIDELADLMMVAPRDIENAIVRIAQMARAVGIHLIIATQRPSVNVVTGLIKANVPSRIALSMATGHDSKTILDQHGAEKLIGHGDMLYLPANASKPHRLQGCYVDENEIEQIVEHCKSQGEVVYADNVVKEGEAAVVADVQVGDATDADLTTAAMELVVRSGLGSTSMLQRKLKIGFARAGRVMDELEEMGIVGPSEGPKARDVLMTVEEFESRAGV